MDNGYATVDPPDRRGIYNSGKLCYFSPMDRDKNVRIQQALEEIARLKNDIESEGRVVRLEAFAGEYADFPAGLDEAVQAVYRRRGIDRLFCH